MDVRPGAARNLDLVVLGQMSLDTIETPSSMQEGLLGGSAVYVALSAASLGLRVGLVTNVGSDIEVASINRLADAGVDITGLQQLPGPTSRIKLRYDGDRLLDVSVLEGVGSLLRPMDFPSAYTSSRMIHVTPAPFETQLACTKMMKAAGATVSFDPHADFNAAPRYRISAILEHTDMVFLNEAEAISVTGEREVSDAIGWLRDAGPGLIALTRGGQGAIISSAQEQIAVPVLKPPRSPVDYVGAGDAFAAGFLTALLDGLSIAHAGLLGAAAAACIIEGLGLSNIPTVLEVGDVLARNGISIPGWSTDSKARHATPPDNSAR
jgi:sugar/nucleoside kinase (ribokinase family)